MPADDPLPREPLRPLLVGRTLYSPGTLAAYSALASLPVGYMLYGLNLRARGHRRLGVAWLCFGAALLALLELLSSSGLVAPRFLTGLGVFAAINLYQFESRPYALAIAHGATRAKWWPPALVLLVATVLLFVVNSLIAVA